MAVKEITEITKIESKKVTFEINNESFKTIYIPENTSSSEFDSKQNNSLEEYKEEHVKENLSDKSKTIYKLFKGYIASSCKKFPVKVLDIGCGISKSKPIYFKDTEAIFDYVGLDPFKINLEREYPFICSKISDVRDKIIFKDNFELFVFSTSLDHIDNLEDCAKSIKKLAKKNALIIFWIGLHDKNIITQETGSLLFNFIFKRKLLFSLPLYFAYGIFRLPKLVFNIFKREYQLKRGLPLDNIHYWYFQEKSIKKYLSLFGNIEDYTRIPGSNHIFVTCSIK